MERFHEPWFVRVLIIAAVFFIVMAFMAGYEIAKKFGFKETNELGEERTVAHPVRSISKRFIRWLYWRYGHKGDVWQTRLIIYHTTGMIRSKHERENVIAGRYFIAQLEDQINSAPRDNFTRMKYLGGFEVVDNMKTEAD